MLQIVYSHTLKCNYIAWMKENHQNFFHSMHGDELISMVFFVFSKSSILY